ncbi:MAG: hypothetical protein JWM46_31 [Candidatus Kaiserbacteria bacterium]|nr:hypothetical protein [Candidatus Kaiserbacteria bacterium]
MMYTFTQSLSTTLIRSAGYIAVAILLLALFFAAPTKSFSQGTGSAITGYGWSDTIGWISFDGPSYGLAVASDGTVSGYAWSDTIGWISANTSDLSGCPSAPCSATLSHGALSGWLKVLSADSGWDGWISLSGSGYGPTLSGGNFSGYAWGSTNVGWLDMALAHSTFHQCGAFYGCSANDVTYTDTECNVTTAATCVAPMACVTGVSTCQYPAIVYNPGSGTTGHLQVRPQVVRPGTTATVFWNISNVSSCAVTGSNGDSWTGASSGSGGKTTAAITERTTYTLTCTGLDSSHISESAVLNVIPVFQEQ